MAKQQLTPAAEQQAIFEELWRETLLLVLRWEALIGLFGHDEERLTILNTTARGFFWMTQRVLFETVFLSIQRLLDPGQSKHGQRSASMETLIHTFAIETSDVTFRRTLQNSLKDLRKRAAGIREWRMRAIAHLDLDTKLNRHPEPLPNIQRELIQSLVDDIGVLMNRIESRLMKSETHYPSAGWDADVDALVWHLKRSLDGLPARRPVEPRAETKGGQQQ